MTRQPTLAHTRVTAPDRVPERWALLLHGIYGSGRNWASIAKRVTEARPEWGALLVDLRLHGSSVGFEPPHDLVSAAADVEALMAELGMRAEAVLGHSFGGKVALMYARKHGDELRQVWVVESTPSPREPGGSAWSMLELVRRLPDEFASRKEAVEALERVGGLETGVAQWMAMNLESVGDRYRWRLDLDGVESMLEDFFATDLWPVVEDPPARAEIHFVKGTASDTLDSAATARVEAAGPRVSLHAIEGGHWLNADNPGALVDLLAGHLP